jgi:hypothetical protein
MPINGQKDAGGCDLAVKQRQPEKDGCSGIQRAEQEERPETIRQNRRISAWSGARNCHQMHFKKEEVRRSNVRLQDSVDFSE